MANNSVNIAYLDCFSGISGDMFLASMIDAGLPEQYLLEQLAGIDLEDFQIKTSSTLDQGGIKATRLSVICNERCSNNITWQIIREKIITSRLSIEIQRRTLAIFSILAEAEAKIHAQTIDDVHFHEVGAIDSIVDIVGAAIGLDFFNIAELISSPLPMPSGWVKCAHGSLPLPAPAVCQILKGVPVYGVDIKQELVTPTGAAIIQGSSPIFTKMPAMEINHIGYGAGSNKREDHKPNLLRLIIGSKNLTCKEHQEVEIIETNLDDWSPELFPYLCEQLFALGALDVTLTPIQMKKGRPGFSIQIISPPEIAMELKNCLLSETSAIGLRFRTENRFTLPREIGSVPTPWGNLQVKKVTTQEGPRLYPEYEHCRKMARKNSVAIKEVYKVVALCSIKDFFT